MLNTVHLHGALGHQFGEKYSFEIATAGEALRALNCAFPGKFIKALQDGEFKLMRGNRDSGFALDKIGLVNNFNLGSADLHIIPVAAGASSQTTKGAVKSIAGVALIGGAILLSGGTLAAPLALGGLTIPGVTWGTIAAVGLGVALEGAATLMSKYENGKPSAAASKDQSFTLNGPANTTEQGHPVPLIYGHVITGSQLVSFDADIENIGAYQE